VYFLPELDEAAAVVEDVLEPDDAAVDDVDDEDDELPHAAMARADATATPSSSAPRLTAAVVTDLNCTALSFD
jgi:hypothetical protein